MLSPRIRAALVVLAASAGVAGCTSFGPYGGVSVGYGSYGYDPYYSGYGYGYGYDPFGWYNGYYYPGSGDYCYDRHRRARLLTAEERAFWRDRIHRRTGVTGTSASVAVKENWSGFNRPERAPVTTVTSSGVSPDAIRERVLERQQAMEQARSERAEARSERSEVRQQSSDDGDHPRLHRRPR